MLDSNQLAHFRERQAVSLMDTCHRLVYSRTFNTLNEPVEIWTENTTDLACGLQQMSGQEQHRDKDTVVSYDAIIRLPLSEVWDARDGVLITKRFGESTTALVYEIASPIQRGPSGIRMLLRKVTNIPSNNGVYDLGSKSL